MDDPLKLVETLFADALALPAEERAAFVAALHARNPKLAAQIVQLLRADEQAGDFLDAAPGLPPPPSEPGAGDTIGPYRLIEKLGEGAVGIVWRASQQAPVRREIALKIIKAGMDTREVIARFEAERQALALMEHPHIARVFDAGATAAGRPYFVMELVRGVPLTTYCDAQRLPTAARLELFIKVCHAVQHAHQKGVIHRDLKPSNILVTSHDGVPVPKVIDFGIAKATSARLTDRTLFTAFTQFIGTPAYMSPEQAEFSGLDLDTRSDIYSLGVLLYELLTGCTPFDARELMRAGFEAMCRRIREEEPARPSARLTTLDGDALRTVAGQRQVEAPRLIGQLRGELDWVVMRCLEKDRTRRYPTANGLAEDVRRYLQDEPVNAVAPSALYTLRKFARRHRAAFAAGLIIAFILLAATALSTALAVRATRAERLAEQRAEAEALARTEAESQRAAAIRAEQKAATEAATSHAISEFLRRDLLAQASPEQQPDRDVKLRTVLDRAAERIEGRFPDQPLVEAALRETLADTYTALGEHAAQHKLFEAATALYARELGEDSEAALRTTARVVQALRMQTKLPEASAAATELLTRAERVLGPEHEITQQAVTSLQGVLLAQGRFRDAEPLLRRSLATSRRTLGPEHVNTLSALSNLALVCTALGQFDEAIALGRESIEIRQRVFGPEHPLTLPTMANLAAAYAQTGRFDEAITTGTEVHTLRQRLLGPEHPQTVSAANILANILVRAGRRDEAAVLFDESIPIAIRVLGADHAAPLAALVARADIHLAAGEMTAAAEKSSAALASLRAKFGPDHVQTLDALIVHGRVRLAQADWAEAETDLTQALAIGQRTLGPANPRTVGVSYYLGTLRLAEGRAAEAVELLAAVHAQRLKTAGETHPETLAATRALGEAQLRQGLHPEAEATLLAAHAALDRALLENTAAQAALTERRREVRLLLAELYDATSRPDEAARWRD
jgi:serine/threonine protein kinase